MGAGHPCKDDIYSAVVNHYFVDIDFVCKQLQAVPTTTDSLMFLVYSVFALACESFGRTPEDTRLVSGIVFRSIISDGKYARRIFSAYEPVQEKMIRCFEEAQKRGKIVVPQDNSWMLFWFCHHLALYLGLLLKAESQIIDYRQGGRRIHLEAVRFCLRGIGVKESLLSKIKLESYSAKLEYLMSDLSSGPYRGQP